MTKADIVREIARKTGMDNSAIIPVIEGFMETVKASLGNGENVYLRGFGSFTIKRRADKKARNIKAGTECFVPAHNIPSFKPAPDFMDRVK